MCGTSGDVTVRCFGFGQLHLWSRLLPGWVFQCVGAQDGGRTAHHVAPTKTFLTRTSIARLWHWRLWLRQACVDLQVVAAQQRGSGAPRLEKVPVLPNGHRFHGRRRVTLMGMHVSWVGAPVRHWACSVLGGRPRCPNGYARFLGP